MPGPGKYIHWRKDLDPSACLSVDGDAPGEVHLSHWPGNRTPVQYPHDLSTGSALLYVKDTAGMERAGRLKYVTNNHYDTDGVCSVFTILNPQAALEHAHLLTAAAAAGDFSLFTTPEGVKIDLTLTALTKAEGSPLRTALFPDEYAARQAQYDHALQLLPRLFENPDLHADWFADEYRVIQRDLRALREDEAEVEVLPALDLAFVITDRPLHETAVNTATSCDRILTVQPLNGSFLYDVRLTTLSWFQLVSRPYKLRLDWKALADSLEQQASGDGRWQADETSDPTPHLSFVDEHGQPAPNPAQPQVVKGIVARFFTQDPYLPAGI
ncbi:MAG: hypothetical protein KF696_02030 [Planctomycetes bacterium]|nr:hypothetical protein [Planctomycetota bacterium]MCW8134780.1 hypothetical protein [Planctomycetota bacterium]